MLLIYELIQSKKSKPNVATISKTKMYLCVDRFTLIAFPKCSLPVLMYAEAAMAFSNVDSIADTWLLMAELSREGIQAYI